MDYKTNLMKVFRYLSLLILMAMMASCAQQKHLDKFNMAKQYVEDYPGRMMQQQIFHKNDSISELSVRLIPSLIPNLTVNNLEVYSYMTLTYAVYSSMDKKDVVSTDSFKLGELVAFDKIKSGVARLKIPVPMIHNMNYVVLVSLQDPVNKKNYLKMLRVFKTYDAAENYRILDKNNNTVWLPWIESHQEVKIQYRYDAAPSIHLSYFKPKFSPARPPYADIEVMEYRKAEVFEHFELKLNKGVSSLIQLPKEGVYKIHAKEDDLSGKTIIQLYDDYPSVAADAQKVFALRYLNAWKDFKLMLQDDAAHTINEFWFFEDRSKERSQELMKTYYARMLRTNHLFTSYKEGWKTDRGMIFMIYGPPDQVYHEMGSEIWEYGADASYNNMRFVFNIINTPLVQKEFVLERSEAFKESWYRLLDYWRNE